MNQKLWVNISLPSVSLYSATAATILSDHDPFASGHDFGPLGYGLMPSLPEHHMEPAHHSGQSVPTTELQTFLADLGLVGSVIVSNFAICY